MLSTALADRARTDLVRFLGEARYVGLVDSQGMECTYLGYQRQLCGPPVLLGDIISFSTVTFATVLDTVGSRPAAWALYDAAGLPLLVGQPHHDLELRVGDLYQATPRLLFSVTIPG